MTPRRPSLPASQTPLSPGSPFTPEIHMRRIAYVLSTALAAAPFTTLTAQVQQQGRASNRIALEQYLDWEEVSAPQLSPDGAQIAFSRRWVDKMNDRWESSVWLMSAD